LLCLIEEILMKLHNTPGTTAFLTLLMALGFLLPLPAQQHNSLKTRSVVLIVLDGLAGRKSSTAPTTN
jgi:hypothetical protein